MFENFASQSNRNAPGGLEQADYTSPFVEIPSLFVHDPDINVRGIYQSNGPEARLYSNYGRSVGHLIVTDQSGQQTLDKGTAFFVSSDGLAATDYHAVMNRNGFLHVRTTDGRMHNAHVVSADPKTDLALLQVDKSSSNETFTPVHLGNSSPHPLQPYSALGFPRDSARLHLSSGHYTGQTALGTLSFHNSSGQDGRADQYEDPRRRVMLMQMNAQIGESGGPIFAADGSVSGIIEATDGGGNGIPFNRDPKLAVVTPVEDLIALINRTRRQYPTQASNDQNLQWYDAIRLGPLSHNPNYRQPQADQSDSWDYWVNRIRNFSFSNLFHWT